VAGVVGLETSGTTRRKRQHKATAEDLDLSGPVELIVLAVKEPAARFKLLGSDRAITSAFRPSRPPLFPPEHLLWHATSSLTPGLTGRSGTAPPPAGVSAEADLWSAPGGFQSTRSEHFS